MIAGIFHGLYLVGFSPTGALLRSDYVPTHAQQATPAVLDLRNPLKSTAKKAGWTHFDYTIEKIPAVGFEQV